LLYPIYFIIDSSLLSWTFSYLFCARRGGHDRMLVGFITNYAISAYHY